MEFIEAKASLELEGRSLTDEMVDLIWKHAAKLISDEDFNRSVLLYVTQSKKI